MYKLLRFHSDAHPLISIRWNWPQNVTTYLLAGVGLAILLVPLGNLLPMPKNVPIDEFFRTARDAYILSFFGILFAPIFEELFFRGFLYPVVESWTHAVFHAPRRIRLGRNLLLLLALWGYCVQRIPARWQPYVTYGLAAVAFLLLVLRVLLQDFELLNRLILPVICFAAWTFVGYFLHGRALLEATVVPLLMAAALTVVLWQRPTPNALSLLALGSAIAITALAFASIHASQLRYSWGPVLIIFLVGIALTTVRALQKSVAATVLMHMAYNATIFVVTYIATDRFRHMEKFNQ
jgi:membrane protease YdiL (CAAX protease family)